MLHTNQVVISVLSATERQALNDEYTALLHDVDMSVMRPTEWDARLTTLHHELALDSTWSSPDDTCVFF